MKDQKRSLTIVMLTFSLFLTPTMNTAASLLNENLTVLSMMDHFVTFRSGILYDAIHLSDLKKVNLSLQNSHIWELLSFIR